MNLTEGDKVKTINGEICEVISNEGVFCLVVCLEDNIKYNVETKSLIKINIETI